VISGVLTVQAYESENGLISERCTENQVTSVMVSYQDRSVQVSIDEERQTWEITVYGKATIWHE
jgi:hypothetical protein